MATDGAWPTTATGLRCPRALTRNTQKPVSSLWNVTRSMEPTRCSDRDRASWSEAVMAEDFGIDQRDHQRRDAMRTENGRDGETVSSMIAAKFRLPSWSASRVRRGAPWQ